MTAGTSSNSSNYQPPPPPTLVESYGPPPPVPPTIVEPYPPPHYYAGYAAGPGGPACYTHSQPARNVAFIGMNFKKNEFFLLLLGYSFLHLFI